MNQSSRFIDYEKILAELSRALDETCCLEAWRCARPCHLCHDENYFREFRTVHIGGGRQTGKTRWIAHHATSDSLVIAINATFRDHLSEYIKQYSPRPHDLPLVTTIRTLQSSALPSRTFREIIVDESLMVFQQHSLKKFYKLVLPLCTLSTKFFLIG